MTGVRWIEIALSCSAVVACGDDGQQPVGPDASSDAPPGTQTLRERCEALPDLTIEGVTGLRARVVEPDAQSANPVHCEVQAIIPDEVGIVVQMPIDGTWNKKYYQYGNLAYSGMPQNGTPLNEMVTGFPRALSRGYAVSGNDGGHSSQNIFDATWALDNPTARAMLVGEAAHRTAVASKLIIAALYEQSAERAYYGGCSFGGRDGMFLTQVYPQDFDGVIAIGPMLNFTGHVLSMIWSQQLLYPNPADLSAPAIPPAKLAFLDSIIATKCGADAENVISQPLSCVIDPAADLPRCRNNNTTDCFTTAELDILTKLFAGPSNTAGPLHPGSLFSTGFAADPANFLDWSGFNIGAADAFGPSTPNLGQFFSRDFLRYFVFDDPAYTYQTFDFDNTSSVLAFDGVDTLDANLTAFDQRGGKLLVVAGWMDPLVNAKTILSYHDAVQAQMGDPSAFFQLFIVPGMGHGAGGLSTSTSTYLTALEGWVERGELPTRLEATLLDLRDGSTSTTSARPFCGHPKIAVLATGGDRADSTAWTCQ